jgi:hypothetical protein
MAKITNNRIGEYLSMALNILSEKGGECPTKELIKNMEERLSLTEYEKSLNNSGQFRWITTFRFYSISLTKADWIKKTGGKWILTNEGKKHIKLPPQEIFDLSGKAYDKWNSEKKDEDINVDYSEEVEEEPEVLMEVKPGDITFQNLLSGISTCRIQIPPFQRSFVWSPSDIRFLLDSIYRGYPIGSFIFWKTIRKLPHTRTIGSLELDHKDINPGTEISYVLDGQQRITSLFAAIKGSTIDGENYRFLFDVRGKKFVVRKSNGEENSDENDYENLLVPLSTLFLGLASYNIVAQRYPEEYQPVLVTLYERLSSYRFSVIDVIDKNPTSEEEQSEGVKQVVRMFSRINETGKKLTVVAKMVARCWGEGFDLREALDDFYKKHPLLEPIREETILQAVSVILNYRKCRSRDILERTNIRKLESDWDSLTQSLLLAVEFTQSKLHIKSFNYLPFDGLLVPLAYIFNKKKELSHTEITALEQWFWRASLSNRYDATVESKIEEDCSAFDELLEGKNPEFSYLIDWASLKSRLIEQRYNLRNAFVKTVLSLYAHAEPKNLTDGRSVSLDGAFTGYYKHNLHHIFPQAYLRRSEPTNKEVFDSIVNIMLIPAITNIGILDMPPSDYFKDFQKTNSELSEILVHHLIPNVQESGIPENDFLKFLDYRAEKLVQAFRVLTGVGSASEAHFDSNPTKPIDIIEGRIRSFVHEKLQEDAGGSYWEEYIPSDIQNVVNQKIQDDLRRHPYKLEEYMRDDVRITFLDVMDYSKIILSNWEVFGKYFISKGEAEQHFRAFKNYRNSIKHNRDLNEVDKRNGEAAVLWLENVLK